VKLFELELSVGKDDFCGFVVYFLWMKMPFLYVAGRRNGKLLGRWDLQIAVLCTLFIVNVLQAMAHVID
jgi:hypothetical protein